MTAPPAAAQLDALIAYLDQDPGNIALRADAAEAALAANVPARALALVGDFADHRLIHIAGLALIQLGRWDEAVHRFAALRDAGEDAPGLRYNLALALAMTRQWDAALDALDPATADLLPQAAALQVGLLHQLGRLDEAAARGRALLALHPDNRALNAASSVLALDVEDEAWAEACAARAGDHPDALTTRAALALDRGEISRAASDFQQALDANPGLPRAWIGRGLARLATNEPGAAADDIDRGAMLFETHLGSWIAAGWAHLLAGDRASARDRFDRALALDGNFAEAHGSRAVIDLLDGRRDDGERGLRVASGLDPACFSAALGRILLAADRGDNDRARLILERALATSIDASGRTVGATLARLGLARGT